LRHDHAAKAGPGWAAILSGAHRVLSIVVVRVGLLDLLVEDGLDLFPRRVVDREIAHLKSFMLALDSLGKDPLDIGRIGPSPEMAKAYFNDSTGSGEFGAQDLRGPWNQDGFDFIEAPVRIEGTLTEQEVKNVIHQAAQ
jgi:hypothetical protein